MATRREGLRSTSEPPAHAPKIREVLGREDESDFARYRRLTCPGPLARFWLFELATMLLLPFPGGLGMLLRRKLLRPFFGALGRGVIIGRNCVFRHPARIFLGDRVAIDDNCLIDARGAGAEGVRIGAGVILSRGVQVKSKNGPISIGRNVNIGDDTKITSESGLSIGDGAAIAATCTLAGGTFLMSEFNRPAPERTATSAGPIHIGAGTWIANGVLVLDGVRIGESSVIGAGSVVLRSLPGRCVAQGNPARKVFDIR